MSKFWQKKYISKYTGAEIDAAVAKAGDATQVVANPTLAGTEAALEGLQVGNIKYLVDAGHRYNLTVTLSNAAVLNENVVLYYGIQTDADTFNPDTEAVWDIINSNGYLNELNTVCINNLGVYYVDNALAGIVIGAAVQGLTCVVYILKIDGTISIETYSTLIYEVTKIR